MERGRGKSAPREMEMGATDTDTKEIISCWITTGDFTLDY